MNGSGASFADLLWGMTLKEFRARYKYTILGFFWLVVNPLLQMAVIGFVFTFFMRQPVPNYYLYLFIGLLVWNFFSISLSKATPSIIWERALIKKAAFPREVIPLSIILSNAIHMLLGFLLTAIPVIALRTCSVALFPYFIAGMGLLLAFTSGVGLLTTATNVRFRDVNFFVQAILLIWFYATPIVYSLSMIPERYRWLWDLNPLTSVVMFVRSALLSSEPPTARTILVNTLVTIGLLIIGWTVFRRESRDFDDWV